MKGVTGENLLQLLERRLDNVVYRAGFATSRAHARQLVNHGHFLVDGEKVDIPSFTVRENQVVTVRKRSHNLEYFKIVREGSSRIIPKWLSVDADKLSINVIALPERDDVDFSLQENMIVEFYSR